MEALAAAITGVSLGFLFVHWAMRSRVEARREAGPLLIYGWDIIPRRMAILVLILATCWAVHAVWHDVLAGQSYFGILLVATIGTSVVCSLFPSTPVMYGIGRSWIEFHEGGIVSGAVGQGSVFTPWHRIAYCQWLDSKGTLSIYSFDPIKVVRSKRQAVAEVLLARTEVRDPSGKTLNPDFVRPEAPPERPWPDRRPFQFELKTILLLMTFLASALAWWATHFRAK
ncbi:MAG TPA: hypothetical protein VJL29_01950 [Thermoguttaceae bacterium]|nr:hypothetical protein [Thermoguttaceae bacterium]